MERKKSHLLVKLIAIALVISLCAPIGAQAAMPETVQPMASAYLARLLIFLPASLVPACDSSSLHFT